MKRVFLLIAISALLAALGFAQTPAAGSNTDSANIKGCLGGSNGDYTVMEDGSRQIFKITASSVDLNPHVGHDVKLTGHKASGAVSSGAGENSFAVTELSMISEHCVAAAAATVGAIVPYSQTVIEPTTATPASAPSAPAVDAAAPAATVRSSAVPPTTPAVEAAAARVSPSSATVSTPAADSATPATTVAPSSAAPSTSAVEAATPAATVSPSAVPPSTSAVEAAAPAATVSPSTATVSPTEKAAHAAGPSPHARRLSATQAAPAPATTVNPTAADAASANPASETVSPASADAATANPSSETASAPAATATTPTATHRAGSLSLLISFVVLVIVLGTLAPLLIRWRKRKMLERTGTPNLSFTNEVSMKEASSDQDKPEPRKVA